VIYGLLNSPSKLENVKFVVVKETGPWRGKIVQSILPFLKPGLDLNPDNLRTLKERINSLPWVEHCKLDIRGGTLEVKIWEEPTAFSLIFRGKLYLIGRNGFVLEERTLKVGQGEVFSYRGKLSPFKQENGFLKLRNFVKIEVNLVKDKIKELNLESKEVQIVLMDVGVLILLKAPSCIVYLSFNDDSWKRFASILKEGFLKPGIYDFRYSGLLVLQGREER
jgi:hypothetical protein